MMKKPIDKDLLNKVKEGLIKSGFPLELQIAKIIEEKGWFYTISSNYLDFETNKLRESDIIADKTINGIQVNLMIECKKSDEKQLVLYQPKVNRKGWWPFNWAKAFPRLKQSGNIELLRNVSEVFNRFPVMSARHTFSNSIIFTKGNQVEQNNSAFFGSINSLIKRSIADHSRHTYNSNYRCFYIYIVIYDGYMLKLTRGKTDDSDFDLTEIDYGQYLTECRFSIPDESVLTNPTSVNEFGNQFVIELMKPSYLNRYLDHLANVLEGVDKQKIEGWGEDNDLPF